MKANTRRSACVVVSTAMLAKRPFAKAAQNDLKKDLDVDEKR